MRIYSITNHISFKNKKYIHDVKNHSYALKEFVEHPDLVNNRDNAKKVIKNLMYRTTQIVNISCIDAIATLKMIKDKYPHLEKISNECIELLEYYNAYKIW